MIPWNQGLLYVHVPSSSFNSEVSSEASIFTCGGDLHSTILASASMVSNIDEDVLRVQETTNVTQSLDTGCRQGVPSGRGDAASNRVEDLPEIKEVLDRTIKPSTSLLFSTSGKVS